MKMSCHAAYDAPGVPLVGWGRAQTGSFCAWLALRTGHQDRRRPLALIASGGMTATK